jgi:hypothetical protein
MAGRPAASRLLPVVLLAALAIIGLRGAAAVPHWDGPLHSEGTAVGIAFEAVLAVLLAATLIRGHRAPHPAAPVARLRAWLRLVLGGGLAAVAVLLLLDAHLHLFTQPHRARRPPASDLRPTSPRPPGSHVTPHTSSIPSAAILYGLLIAVLAAAAVLGLVWVLRHRPPPMGAPRDVAEEDMTGLRNAVASGSDALRQLDDARAAIIACYAAMERSLAEAGTARAAADTPDELLARATATGIVRGDAAARLTGLFYEARFSSHPMSHGQRDEAGRALDELGAALQAPAAAAADS